MQTEPIANGAPAQDPRLERVRALLEHLEAGNEAEAGRLLDELTRLRETQLFQELGRLTRELHNALTAFRLDDRFAAIAQIDIPDAKQRLHYVIRMTEQAASRTLSAVEESRPRCGEIARRAEEIRRDWRRFLGRDMRVQEFRALAAQLNEFLPLVAESAGKVHESLSEVLMAQSFQDLTGQIIKRVITLVEEVEQNLVNLIRLSGQKLCAEAARPAEGLEGPALPGRGGDNTVSGQDEVDALLSSLGF